MISDQNRENNQKFPSTFNSMSLTWAALIIKVASQLDPECLNDALSFRLRKREETTNGIKSYI